LCTTASGGTVEQCGQRQHRQQHLRRATATTEAAAATATITAAAAAAATTTTTTMSTATMEAATAAAAAMGAVAAAEAVVVAVGAAATVAVAAVVVVVAAEVAVVAVVLVVVVVVVVVAAVRAWACERAGTSYHRLCPRLLQLQRRLQRPHLRPPPVQRGKLPARQRRKQVRPRGRRSTSSSRATGCGGQMSREGTSRRATPLGTVSRRS
jgi:hypothetical protein